MKIEIKGAVPCSICGELPILQGGYGHQQHTARLACPNYKKHARGFTPWHCDDWWTKEQAEEKGMPKLVNIWNIMHSKKR